MAVPLDPTDPRRLTPDQRLEELTALLAAGVRRLLAVRASVVIPATPSPPQIPPESQQIRLDEPPGKCVHATRELTQRESTEGVGP